MPLTSEFSIDISGALRELDKLAKAQEKIFGSPSKPRPMPPPSIDAHKAALDAIARETKRTADLKVQYESTSVREITAQMNKLKNEYGSIQAAMLKETDARVKAEEKAQAQSVQQQIRDLERLRVEKGGGLLDVVRQSGLGGGIVGGLIGGGVAGALPIIAGEVKDVAKEVLEFSRINAQLNDSFHGNAIAAREAAKSAQDLGNQYQLDIEGIKQATVRYAAMGGNLDNIREKQLLLIGLMKRTGEDADTAGMYVAKLGNPEVQARLAALNIHITKGADETQRLREVMQQLQPDMELLTREAGDSALGADHMDVAWKNLKETLAGQTGTGESLSSLLNGIADAVKTVTGALNNPEASFASFKEKYLDLKTNLEVNKLHNSMEYLNASPEQQKKMTEDLLKGRQEAADEAYNTALTHTKKFQEEFMQTLGGGNKPSGLGDFTKQKTSLKEWYDTQKAVLNKTEDDKKDNDIKLLQLDIDYYKKLKDIQNNEGDDTRATDEALGKKKHLLTEKQNAEAKQQRAQYISQKEDALKNDQANEEAAMVRADDHARKLEHDRQRDLLAFRVKSAQETLDLEQSLNVKKTGDANKALANAQSELMQFDQKTREEAKRKWNELSIKLIKGQAEAGKKQIEEKKKEGAEIVKLQAEISGSEQEKAVAAENVRFAEEEDRWKGHKDIIQLIEKDHALKMAEIMNKEGEDSKKVKEAFVSSFQGIIDKALSPLEKAMTKTNNIVGQEALNLIKKLAKIGEDKLVDLITGKSSPASSPVQSDTNIGDANFTAGQIKYVVDKYGHRYRPSSSDKVDISPNAGESGDTDEITSKAQETGIKFGAEQLLEKGLHLAGFGEAAGAVTPIGIIADAALAVHEHDKDAMEYQARHTLHGSESTAVSTPNPFMGGARLFGDNAFQSPAERMGIPQKQIEALQANTKATQDNSADTKLNSQSITQSAGAVKTLAEKMGLNKKVAGKAGDVIDIFSSVGDLLGFAEGGVIGAPMVAFGKGGAVRLAENEPEAVLPLKEYNRYKQFTSGDTPNVSSNINIGINGTMKARGNTLQQVIENDTMVSQLTRA